MSLAWNTTSFQPLTGITLGSSSVVLEFKIDIPDGPAVEQV